MIEVQNVTFSYNKKIVLNSISAEFEKGHIYGIIGPNGSGKSTLLRIISGILACDDGGVFLEGKDISSLTRRHISQKIGFMAQSRALCSMSVEEYIACGRFPYRRPFSVLSENDKKILQKALQDTDMFSLKDRGIETLSGGERQRAYFAMLLCQGTEYLLCDEPTTFLDISAEKDFLRLLDAARTEGKCVVTVMHNLPAAFKYCDKILVLDNGSSVAFDTPDYLLQSEVIKKVFGADIKKISQNYQTHYVLE